MCVVFFSVLLTVRKVVIRYLKWKNLPNVCTCTYSCTNDDLFMVCSTPADDDDNADETSKRWLSFAYVCDNDEKEGV